mgnify:FL=1
MKTLTTLAAMVLSTTSAFAQPAMVARTDKGEVLVDGRGMSLYTVDKDSDGKSVCEGKCATNWPPLAAKAGDTPQGGFAPIARPDGSAQWSYKGQPLFGWVKDHRPGDVTGDGVNGIWHLARP